MLDKLLALLVQSKGAAVSLVFVLGSTTALVSATTNDNVTTITITKQAATNASHMNTESSAAPADQTVGGENGDEDNDNDEDNDEDDAAEAPKDNTAPAGTNGCSEQARADAAAVRLVDSTFVKDQLALIQATKGKGADARQIAAGALVKLREIRQNAVKAIHAANTCAKNEEDEHDRDNDENDEDNDEATTTTTTTTTTTVTVTTSADVNAIAQVAVKAMTTAFTDAKAKIDALPLAKTTKGPTNSGGSSGRSGEHRSGSSGDKEHERD